MGGFEAWLSSKLTELGTDESVFSPYIIGILSGDEELEEKRDGILEILSDVMSEESLINSVLKEIEDEWRKFNNNSEPVKPSLQSTIDISDQMHKIMEEKMQSFSLNKHEISDEQKKIKQAILASYSQVEDGDENDDEDDDDDDHDLGPGSSANVQAVQQAQAEWRETQRQSAMAKKDKDKQDRENQKKQAEDRKKKAQDKSAKGERRSGR